MRHNYTKFKILEIVFVAAMRSLQRIALPPIKVRTIVNYDNSIFGTKYLIAGNEGDLAEQK